MILLDLMWYSILLYTTKILQINVHDFRKTLVALNKGFKSVKGCTFKNKYDVFQHNDLFSCVCLPVFFGKDFLLFNDVIV